MKRFTSRKFIMALVAQVVAVLAFFFPEHSGAIEDIAMQAAALLVSVLSAIGYAVAEGAVDKARAGAGKEGG